MKKKCDCKNYERQVCDICQGVVGKKLKDMTCRHKEFVYSRDGKECKECGLSWHLCLKEERKKMKDKIGGKKITRKQALRGLGNPKNWEKEKEKLMKEFNKKPTVEEQKDKFINEGIVPNLPAEKRLADSLARCLWMLKDREVQTFLRSLGYECDFVIQQAEEALQSVELSPQIRFASVREMLVATASIETIKKFDELADEMIEVRDHNQKLLGWIIKEGNRYVFDRITYKEIKQKDLTDSKSDDKVNHNDDDKRIGYH